MAGRRARGRRACGRVAAAIGPRRLGIHWGTPATATYVVLALFFAKIVHIKAAAPLPVDRTIEHQRYLDARRRQDLRVIDSMRWLFLFVFVGYVVLHGSPAAQQITGLRWVLIAVGVGIWLAMVAITIVGVRRLDAMGRGLRPPASWAGPFRASPWASRGGGVWALSFVSGPRAAVRDLRSLTHNREPNHVPGWTKGACHAFPRDKRPSYSCF